MSRLTVRRTLAAVTTSVLALGFLAAVPISADAATYQAFGASAYGSQVKVGNLVSSGKTSYLSMCTTDDSYTKTNKTAAASLGALGNVGVLTTKVTTKKTGSTFSSVTTTQTGALNLLGGLITASAITSTAIATVENGVVKTGASTDFVNLRIANLPIDLHPTPNSGISIPGVADVLFNQQSVSMDGKEITVNAFRVNLLKNNGLNLPSGFIVLGNAKASVQTIKSLPYGSAYGTQVDLLGIITSGATAQVNIPCGGSDGVKKTANLVGLNVPGVISTGVARTSAVSTEDGTTTTATTKAIVDGVNLLNGAIRLDTITSKSSTTRKGTKVTTSSAGSSLVGLKINGKSITVSAKENTKIDVAGLGTIYLNKVVRTSTSIQVTGLSVTLNTAIGDLTKGTSINVGVSKAGVKAP
ncbi:MAG TPA: choice-of-anchor P family protein [Propionibacteriaceae bacterium]